MSQETMVYPPCIVRREDRGLCVAGTRKTLYAIMDLIKEEWPPKLIRDWMQLTDEQMECVIEYIDKHYKEFQTEYEKVVKEAEADRKYWEERNREKLHEIRKMEPAPGKEVLWKKIQARKTELGIV